MWEFICCFAGKNIPPRCIPVKIPIDILDGTEFCLRFFDIFTPAGKAAHACVAVQVQIPDFPTIEVQIACVEAGLRGVRNPKKLICKTNFLNF